MGTMTYIWRIAADCPDNLIVVYDKTTMEPTMFRKGTLVECRWPVRFRHGGMRSDLLGQQFIPNSAMFPLVSRKAGYDLKLLVGEAAQFVPASIQCKDGDIETTLINPLAIIAAVDWENSKAMLIPGTNSVMKFAKLQLLSEAMNGRHLARLDEFRPFVLASEAIKDLFADSQLCDFALPNQICP